MEQSLLEGAVLCGGGSMLNGMCDMAERVLNCPARNGLAIGIKDWPDELDNPVWTTAAGLAMYSARLKNPARIPEGSRAGRDVEVGAAMRRKLGD